MGLFGKKKYRIMYSKKYDGYYIQSYSIFNTISIWENGWTDVDNVIHDTYEKAEKALRNYRD